MIHTDAGYYTIATPPAGGTAPVFEHLWYLKDYLGNNRVLADAGGSMVGWKDYDPFGEEIAISVTNQSGLTIIGDYESPYRYGGKEWNATTSTYDFEARYLSPSFHRFTTMDPLCEKYYGISPYAYCANDPVNLVDPEGMTNWRAIKKGVLTLTAGIGSFAGGVALSAGTGGVATSLGAVFIMDGVSGIGLGLGEIIIGFVADSSEETTSAVESLPSDMTNTLLKSSDIISGNDNGEIEKIGNGLKIVLGAGATQKVTGLAGTLSRVGTGVQLYDFMSSIPIPEQKDTIVDEDEKKRLNSEALMDSRVDW